MLREIKDFLAELTGDTKPQSAFDESDYRVAAAALLVHVATLDGALTETFREALHRVLKERFGLADPATEELIDAAVAADRESVDFYHFTSLLNRTLDDDGRRRVVEMMWRVAYADGRVSEFEENVLWRVADLLNIPGRERIELRRAVAGTEKQGEDT
jgi:uncharacterized tellurite resistance protein B-like protein